MNIRFVYLVLAALLQQGCQSVKDQSDYTKYDLQIDRSSGSYIDAKLNVGGSNYLWVNGTVPEDSKAVVLFFPGGNGTSAYDLFGTGQKLISNKIGFVQFRPPSNLSRGYVCCRTPTRSFSGHLKDIGRVIGFLQDKTGLPVWVMGHSMGSVSAANATANLPEKVAGAVFLASITARVASGSYPRNETPVTGFNFEGFTGAVFAAGHVLDGCISTPSSGAEKVVRKFANSSSTVAKEYGDANSGSKNPSCVEAGQSPYVPHTFNGVSGELGDDLSKFILENTLPL